MQNDVLKNEIAPWQEKGRWYHGAYNLSDLSFVTDKTDIQLLTEYEIVTPSGVYSIIRPKVATKPELLYEPVFAVYKTSGVTLSGPVALTQSYITNTGLRGIVIGPATGSDGVIEFWVFIVYNSNNE